MSKSNINIPTKNGELLTSLGIETLGSVMTKVIKIGDQLPSQASQVFSTAEDNQSAVTIHVLMGTFEMASDNESLGQFNITGIPKAPRGTPQIEVTFQIDIDGNLTVTACEKKTSLFGFGESSYSKPYKIQFQGRVHYLTKGKFQKLLKPNEQLLIDGCHSIASAKNLYEYLKTLKEPIYGIWGMQKNKLPKLFIKSFKKIFKKVITVTIPNELNAIDAKKLKSIAQKYVLTDSSPNIQAALEKLSSKEKKTIVIFGSLYLIGDVLSKN